MLERAQLELATLGKRAAIDQRDTHEHLEPQVGSYAKQFKDAGHRVHSAMASIQIVRRDAPHADRGNVAMLLFARAATRQM
jgi:hypothetical protein